MIAIGLFLCACTDKSTSDSDSSVSDTATEETVPDTGTTSTADTETTDDSGSLPEERVFSLADADAVFIGEGEEDYAGLSVSAAGDVDNDGFDDMFISAYRNENSGVRTGASYLISGGSTATVATGVRELVNSDAKLIGEAEDDYAGWSISTAGDVNNDGYSDLIIGAFAETSGGFDAGAAYIVLGGSDLTGERSLDDANAKFIGEEEGDYAGYHVGTAGDFNGDGFDDVLIGAIQEGIEGKGGTVYLVLDPVIGEQDLSDASIRFIGEEEGDDAGRTTGSAGDIDGDGYADVFVGSYINENGGMNTGAAYIVLGASDTEIVRGARDLADADAKFIGENDNGGAGNSVSGAGDMNNDGYDDLIVGAYAEKSGGLSAGAAYIVLGGSDAASVLGERNLADSDARFIGEEDGDNAGYAVSSAGDFNNDGFDDVVIGAPGHSESVYHAGAAYLMLGGAASMSGEVDLADADAKFLGEQTSDLAGWAVSGAGDVNSDGYSDLLIGAYGNDSGGKIAGAAYLVLGGGF